MCPSLSSQEISFSLWSNDAQHPAIINPCHRPQATASSFVREFFDGWWCATWPAGEIAPIRAMRRGPRQQPGMHAALKNSAWRLGVSPQIAREISWSFAPRDANTCLALLPAVLLDRMLGVEGHGYMLRSSQCLPSRPSRGYPS